MVDFVAGEPRRSPAPQRLNRLEGDVDIEQAQPLDHARAGLDAIVDRGREHLKSAADAQHRPARTGVGDNGIGDPVTTHPGQVGDCCLGTGNDHHIGVGDIRRVRRPPHGHPRLAGDRLDIGGIGDTRQPHRSHPQPFLTDRVTGLPHLSRGHHGNRILGIEPQLVVVRQHPVGGSAGQRRELFEPGLQQSGIAAKLVDDETCDQPLVRGLQHRHRTEQMCQHSAAINVTDQHHGQARRLRQPHIGDIGCPQVDLGDRSGTLADHHIIFFAQRPQILRDHLPQFLTMLDIRAGADVSRRVTSHHQLRGAIAPRFEKHRIEPNGGFQTAGARL
ncbi:Uncharacterised protein [Mycobacteroides abscessus subsp. abscessus]|nr:Uncharacterised protein [Mycobacteroides abscessus subsp. abscessus]